MSDEMSPLIGKASLLLINCPSPADYLVFRVINVYFFQRSDITNTPNLHTLATSCYFVSGNI